MVDYYQKQNSKGTRNYYFALDKDRVVGALNTQDFAAEEIPYFDTESKSGYSHEYLKYLHTSHPSDEIREAAGAMHFAERAPALKYHDNETLAKYKETIDNKVDRETLWVERPERKHIDYAMSDPSYKPHMATLFGIALSKGPSTIEASGSLSSQSSRLAKHAKDIGFNVIGAPENESMETTNNIDTETAYDELSDITADFSPHNATKLTPKEVSSGKQFLKNTIREGKKKKQKQETPKAMTRSERHAQGIYVLPGFEEPE